MDEEAEPGKTKGLVKCHKPSLANGKKPYRLDVICTTPTEVLGVLPVIVIFGLWEYSQYCYTTFVGVLPMSSPSVWFLTVWEWSHKYYTTFVGVLP